MSEFVPFDRAGIAYDPPKTDAVARGIGERVRARMLANLLRSLDKKSLSILAIGEASVQLVEQARAIFAMNGDAVALRVVAGTVEPPFVPASAGPVGIIDIVVVASVSETVPRRILSVEAGEWVELHARAEPREYRWIPVKLAAAIGEVHAATLMARVSGPQRLVIAYPTALFELLRRIEPLLAADGVVLVSDTQGPPAEDVISPRDAAPSLDFGLLEAFVAEVGGAMVRTGDPSRSVAVGAVCQPGMEEAFAPRFEAAYGKAVDDDAADFARSARAAQGLEAVRYWSRCAEIAPEDAVVRHSLARTGIDAGLARPALASIDGITGAVGDLDFDFQRGRAHAALGEIEAAIEAYGVSLERVRHPVTLSNLGALHLLAGDLAVSATHYREALAMAPNLAVALDGLARVESFSG